MARSFLSNSHYLENLESSLASLPSFSPKSKFPKDPADSPLWHLVFFFPLWRSSLSPHPASSLLSPCNWSEGPALLLKELLCCSLPTPAIPPPLSGLQCPPLTLLRPPLPHLSSSDSSTHSPHFKRKYICYYRKVT